MTILTTIIEAPAKLSRRAKDTVERPRHVVEWEEAHAQEKKRLAELDAQLQTPDLDAKIETAKKGIADRQARLKELELDLLASTAEAPSTDLEAETQRAMAQIAHQRATERVISAIRAEIQPLEQLLGELVEERRRTKLAYLAERIRAADQAIADALYVAFREAEKRQTLVQRHTELNGFPAYDAWAGPKKPETVYDELRRRLEKMSAIKVVSEPINPETGRGGFKTLYVRNT